MSLTISKARQSLFALVDAADRGEKVGFTHKGRTFFIVAEKKPSKLSRLKPLDILPAGVTIEDVDTALSTLPSDWERNNRT